MLAFWVSTNSLGFDSRLGGTSDFELQGLQLLQSSHSGFDACLRLP